MSNDKPLAPPTGHHRPPRGGRRRLVGVSTKMYFDYPTTLTYAHQVASLLPATLPKQAHATDIFVLPDFVTLVPVSQALHPLGIWLGGQDAAPELRGAYTGEVSSLTLSQVPGVKLVEVGHAERRRFFGETDQSVVRKALAALSVGLTPLICIGEQNRYEVSTTEGRTAAINEIWTQVQGVLVASELPTIRSNSPAQCLDLVLAYEPVWAIGASQPASTEYVVLITQALRAKVEPYLAPGGLFNSIRILYGGSAGPGTFSQIQEGVDGLFLGRFAHDPQRFVQTILEVSGAE